MDKLKAIIVDDEESARDVLANLLRRFCPEIELTNKYSSVLQAVEGIKNDPPDVVFLDIEMPNYAGYELVRFFENVPFSIIFVTAYDQYAIRAFEIAAIDYLLKPVDIDRLKMAVARVRQQHGSQQHSERLSVFSESLESPQFKNIIVSDKGQQHLVAIESIIAIEAQESYCTIHTTEKKYTVSKNLKHFETLFEGLRPFIRVHKSWIINKNHLRYYSKSDLLIEMNGGLSAKLSKYKKAEFEAAILS